MRVAGEDELVDAELVVLLDPVGDLLVAADQRGAGAAADQADAGPEVGVDLAGRPRLPPWRASIRRWPSDSLRRRPCLHPRDRRPASMPASSRSASAQASSAVSRVIVCSRMPKRSSRPSLGGELADPRDLLGDGVGRLAPGEVDVGVPGGDRRRRPARSRRSRSPGPGRGAGPSTASSTWRCSPAKSTVSPRHSARTIVQELVAAGVARVLVEEVAVRPLLVALAAGDDVEQQPAAGEVLEGGGHLRGEVGRGQAGPEGDEELQPLGDLAEHRGGQPGVLAPGAGRA